MTRRIWNFVGHENAATAIEYALLGGLIALMVVSTGVTGIGTTLSSYFSEVSSALK